MGKRHWVRDSSFCTAMHNDVQSASMSDSMTVSEARATLPQILRRVLAGEEVTLTRHGEPVAVLVRPDTLRARRASRARGDAGRIRELIAAGRKTTLRPRPRLTEQRAAGLLAEVQAARSKR